MPKREETPAETLAALIEAVPAERQQQLVDALLDKACGYRWWAGEESPPGVRGAGVLRRRVRVIDLETDEEVKGWVYEIPPDPQAAKLVLEYRVGRPAQQDLVRPETEFWLIHRVPGRRDQVPETAAAVADLPEEPVEDLTAMDLITNPELTIQDVFPKDPVDVLAEDVEDDA